jgi:MFS family permease
VIAAGVGLDVVALGRLVGLRSLMGLAAPVGGIAGDRRGFRDVVCASLVVEAVGLALIAAAGDDGVGYAVLVAGMVLSGLGIAWFVPAMQAYASAHLPYARRARGMGMIEYAWALTGIVTLFLAGRLIEATTWRAPFVVLSVLMLVAAIVFSRLPSDARLNRSESDADIDDEALAVALSEPASALALNELLDHPPAEPSDRAPATFKRAPSRIGERDALKGHQAGFGARVAGFFRLGPGAGSAYAEIAAGALFYFAAFQVLLVHGAWLQDEYGLNAAGLGTVALVFGVFDLVASVSVSLFVDRIGKRRSVLAGLVAGTVAYLLIPALDRGLVAAVAGLTLARCLFEFTIVSHFPLLSEQIPTQRGKVLTLGTSLGLVAATLAGVVGPWLYSDRGIGAVAFVSAATMAAAGMLVAVAVREPA